MQGRECIVPNTTTRQPRYQIGVRVPVESIREMETIQRATGETVAVLIRRLLREEAARLAERGAAAADGR